MLAIPCGVNVNLFVCMLSCECVLCGVLYRMCEVNEELEKVSE